MTLCWTLLLICLRCVHTFIPMFLYWHQACLQLLLGIDFWFFCPPSYDGRSNFSSCSCLSRFMTVVLIMLNFSVPECAITGSEECGWKTEDCHWSWQQWQPIKYLTYVSCKILVQSAGLELDIRNLCPDSSAILLWLECIFTDCAWLIYITIYSWVVQGHQ